MTRPALTVLVVFLLTAATAVAVRTAAPAAAAGQAARDLLESFDAAERAEIVLDYADDSRTGWHFIPKDDRKGLPLSEMTEPQREATMGLVRTLLSQVGEEKVTGAMRLEGLVAELEGEGRRWPRDPALYYLTMFGQPAEFGEAGRRWGISFEGHHVSLNFVLEGDRVVDSTPQFLGAHPAVVKNENATGYEIGFRLLRDEEQIGFDLLASLDDDQRAKAIISQTAPKEVLSAAQPSPLAGAPKGLPASEMTETQRELLAELIDAYLEIVADPLAEARAERFDDESPEEQFFAWAGGDRPGQPHYYRIETPSLEIELANTQPDAMGNPANHLHAMLRDNRGDFGLDE